MRKFLALVLSFIITASAVTTVANAAKFTDVAANDETLTKAVDLLSSVGITTGTTETTFGTSEGVTRQQMATFIYRLMKAGKTVEGKEGDNSTTFTDLDDPFYYFMISWANDMGIIKGRNATTFDPKGGIILQDAYVMVVRALGYEKEGALSYPYDYIRIAEDIGLDEGLPASVNYDTALTRGNVAVILYNAFYADMATGETAYDIEYEQVTLANGKVDVVEKSQTVYTIYDTVAEKIFGIKETVQRVVATPNYSLDDFEKTDKDSDGTEMISLECFDEDYIDTDADLFSGDIAFDTLGIEGAADDYFLIDLSIFYKKEEGKNPEIISTSVLGSRTKAVPGSKIKFERNSGTDRQDYMLTSKTQGVEARFKRFTGKVTVDGKSSYLFNAPWSYSKPENIDDKDNECITLLWMDATDRDPEDEEYVQDFNFKSHRDVTGRGAEYYETLSRTKYYSSGKTESEVLSNMDKRGGGLYTTWGFYISMIIDPHNDGNYFEADVWDSNDDGKIDYMWLKPYTMGQAIVDEGEPFFELHGQSSEPMDNYGSIYDQYEVPSVYTYGATNDGAKFKEDQVIIGYINGPANYMTVNSVADLKYETHTFTSKSSRDGNAIGLDGGSTSGKWGASLRYIGFPGNEGTRPSAGISSAQLASGGPFITCYFKDDNLGKEFAIAEIGGLMFHVKSTSNIIGDGDNYAIIFPNTRGAYAYTTSVGIVTDGNLQKSGNMLEVMIDGELVDVQVKPQTSTSVNEDTDGLMPVTPKQANGVYDFSDYVGKLLTYTVNSEDQYVFRIAPLDEHEDDSVLSTDEIDAYYTYQTDAEGKDTAAFVNTTSNLYQFVNKGTNTVNTKISPFKYVQFTDNTKVVIKTVDDEDEVEFTIYDSEDMPNFSNDDDLKNIKYIVKNNPKSSSMEELIYLYAEAVDGSTSTKIGNTLDFRFVKGSKIAKNDDEQKVVYYDVYNPFKGTVEEEYEAVSTSDKVVCEGFGIYSLSGGYIADENLLGKINAYGSVAGADTTIKSKDLGLVEIGDYDKENGLLAIEDEDMLYKVDEDTIITFLDLDEEEISIKSESILTSTSASYRCGDNKKMPLLAFIASSEIKKEDEMEYAEIICVVRYNDLDVMGE